MSILYDYLSVLEKKRNKENSAEFSSPAGVTPAVSRSAKVASEKKGFLLSPKFSTVFTILLTAGVLFFLAGEFKDLVFDVFQKTKPSGQKMNTDETVLPPAPARAGFDYSLKGIIYNSASPSAVIDGKIVTKGAMLGDWQVVDISPSEVKLENLKNSSALILKLESITTP